ncbi:NAD(P)-binding domain-containing protein [Streptomyces flaveolus]|uniref:NAD(P)-binding domain-containing protein n=1 Tax=Streptomyces flaveolus TaxID=67297 RepID=UPI0037F78AB1
MRRNRSTRSSGDEARWGRPEAGPAPPSFPAGVAHGLFRVAAPANSTERGMSMSDITYGVVGLGHIGRRLVAGLRRGGHNPVVHDVSPAAVDAAGEVDAAKSAAELAARADVTFVAVLSAEQVRAVVLAPDGLLGGARPGSVVVVMSTIDLPSVREIAAECEAREVVFADCGVTVLPGSTDDQARSVVAMVGVPDAARDGVVAALDPVARSVVVCGGVGAGMATKIARNVMTYGGWTVAAAASRMLAAAGVTDEGLRQAIADADPEGRTLFQLEHEVGFTSGNRPRRERISGLIEKDLGAAAELSRTVGVSTALVEFVIRERAELLKLVERGAADPEEGMSRYDRGRRWMDIVYGPGFHDQSVDHDGSPYNLETVEHLFGDIWSRPGLSLRERRMLVMGASAQLGRGDLIETQVYGGLLNGEFSEAELNEMMIQLTPYVGWGKSSAVNKGIKAAVSRWKARPGTSAATD